MQETWLYHLVLDNTWLYHLMVIGTSRTLQLSLMPWRVAYKHPVYSVTLYHDKSKLNLTHSFHRKNETVHGGHYVCSEPCYIAMALPWYFHGDATGLTTYV